MKNSTKDLSLGISLYIIIHEFEQLQYTSARLKRKIIFKIIFKYYFIKIIVNV